MFNKLLCKIGIHNYYNQQYAFMIETGRCEVVIAWSQCKICAHSKLVHILK